MASPPPLSSQAYGRPNLTQDIEGASAGEVSASANISTSTSPPPNGTCSWTSPGRRKGLFLRCVLVQAVPPPALRTEASRQGLALVGAHIPALHCCSLLPPMLAWALQMHLNGVLLIQSSRCFCRVSSVLPSCVKARVNSAPQPTVACLLSCALHLPSRSRSPPNARTNPIAWLGFWLSSKPQPTSSHANPPTLAA